jgi:hypothetical protein
MEQILSNLLLADNEVIQKVRNFKISVESEKKNSIHMFDPTFIAKDQIN